MTKASTKYDLMYSSLVDGWTGGKEQVDKLLGIMNSKGTGLEFSRDSLMRLCLVLVNADTKSSFTQSTIKAIRFYWIRIYLSLDTMSSLLWHMGYCKETLISYDATIPIAYYLFKDGIIDDRESVLEVRKFLAVAFARQIFDTEYDQAIAYTRNILRAINCNLTPFRLSLFASVVLSNRYAFTIDEREIERWIDTYEKGKNTYTILALLYPNLKPCPILFHQDNCHPYASFDNKKLSELGLSTEQISEWQRKRNLLPNLLFLEGGENESKNKTPLKEWVEAGNSFCYHPEGVSLELKDFDVFFDKRKDLIKEKLKKIFEIVNNN